MNWYYIYKISTYIRDVKKFPNEDHYSVSSFENYVTTLHELEFKSYSVNNLRDYVDILPERKKNVIERIRQIGWRYFYTCREELLEVFSYWEKEHSINDIDAWSERWYEIFVSSHSSDEEAIKDIIHSGGYEINLDRGVVLTPEDIISSIDEGIIKERIIENFWNNMEFYESEIEWFLEEKYKEKYKKSDLDAVEFVEENGLEEGALDSILENTDFGSYIEDNEEYDIIQGSDLYNAIKTKFYEKYINAFGSEVEDVLDNIGKVRHRLESINSGDSLSDMTIAVSLALNVMHVFGNIAIDYGDLVRKEYLDWLDSGTGELADEWEEEVNEEFIPKYENNYGG